MIQQCRTCRFLLASGDDTFLCGLNPPVLVERERVHDNGAETTLYQSKAWERPPTGLTDTCQHWRAVEN